MSLSRFREVGIALVGRGDPDPYLAPRKRRNAFALPWINWPVMVLWIMPAVALLLTPLLLWTGVTGNLMNLGGDDSHLMYAYPDRWLGHGSFSVLDQNLGGYNPRIYFVPFTALVAIVRFVDLNAQGLFFGLALGSTYLGVAWLVIELVDKRDLRTRMAGVFAGILAISAPLVAETQWTSLLTAMYWQLLVPWLLFLFLRSQKRGGPGYGIVAGVMTVALAPTVAQLPWTLSCGLVLVAVGVAAAWAGAYRFSVRRLLVFAGIVAAMNIFWIGPMMLNPFLHEAQFAAATSAVGKAGAIRIVEVVAPLMSVQDAVSLRMSGTLLRAFSHPELSADQWSQALWLLGLLPLLIVLAAMVKAAFSPKLAQAKLLVGLVGISVVFLYFQTVPGRIGRQLFEELIRYVPGWTAERNFFDKFAIPLVEIFAITAGVSFAIVLSGLGARALAIVTTALCAALILYDAPFFVGAEFKQTNYNDVTYTRVMPGLPTPYLSMLNRLERLAPGPVLTLPLSRPAWSVVPSDRSQGVYIGISPIYWLTGRSDYNGIDAFASTQAPFLSGIIDDELQHGRLESFEAIVAELGVRYVVVSKQDDAAHAYYRVAAVSNPVLEASETARLASDLAPRIIGQYGAYELREVTPIRTEPVVSLESGACEDRPAYLVELDLGRAANVDPRCSGIASPTYSSLGMDSNPSSCRLIFRQPYVPGWQARLIDDRTGQTLSRSTNALVNGFENAFPVPCSVTQVRSLRIVLSYGPAIINVLSALASGLLFIGIVCIGYTREVLRFSRRVVGASAVVSAALRRWTKR